MGGLSIQAGCRLSPAGRALQSRGPAFDEDVDVVGRNDQRRAQGPGVAGEGRLAEADHAERLAGRPAGLGDPREGRQDLGMTDIAGVIEIGGEMGARVPRARLRPPRRLTVSFSSR